MSVSFASNAHQTVSRAAPAGPADAIERLGVRMAYAKDEEIFGQEEPADLIYQVVGGAVRTSRLLSDGRRQIGDFYYPGDVFGLEAGSEHRFTAEALRNSVILVVKRSALRGADGAELERAIWVATVRELERTQEHLLLLGRKTACEKVASFLMDVVGRAGGPDAELPMGRQDMADYLGLTIETVSRMLSQLQSTAVVEFGALRRFRIMNPQAMARLAA